MNKNGVIAVVVVVAAVILVGLWAMRSGEQAPGGVDCSAPPAVPTGVDYSKTGDVVTITWANGSPSDAITAYVIDAKTKTDQAPTIFYAPGTATRFTRQAPANTYYVHVTARNNCGVSAPSGELVITIP